MNRALLVIGVLVAMAGCPGKNGGTRPYAEPKVADVIAQLATARGALTSFRGDSTMDYWMSGKRVKGEVLVMGAVGKKIRFAALSPAGGSTLAEMACDGTNFVYLDYQNNCSLAGPCDARSVSVFFGIELEPDDFLHLALGTPPILDGATGTVTWDGSRGVEKVDLKAPAGAQKLSIDAKDNHYDVLDSELVGTDGKVRWSVANTSFEKVTGSGERRVPKKTRFKSPAQNQDLLVEWNELEANVDLEPEQFHIDIPAGLGICGQTVNMQPQGAAPAPAPKP
jgi:outer membrane lipoprotein-sorting protein